MIAQDTSDFTTARSSEPSAIVRDDPQSAETGEGGGCKLSYSSAFFLFGIFMLFIGWLRVQQVSNMPLRYDKGDTPPGAI
jgi:hypothetical protein